MENLNLTHLEKQVITALIANLYAEMGFSDVTVTEIAEFTGLTSKVIRGVLGSLIKKEIIDTYDNGDYVIIYLNEPYYYLHPEWSKQI